MTAGPRIVSLLPSATEMAYALGLSDRLVGVTHECDYPPEARSKPTVVRNALPIESMTQREIDTAVAERLRQNLSLYELDFDLLEKLAPDLIITQSLCDVCAPSGNEMARLLDHLSKKPEVLWMTPRNLGEVAANIGALGEVTGRQAAAEQLVQEGQQRLQRVAEKAARASQRPRVFCMEWLDPVYCSGHWVPEMVRIAGGIDVLGRESEDSVRIAWEDVVEAAPDVLVFMPCGYDLEAALQHAGALRDLPGFGDLPAARTGRIYVVDANDYFARPGPRVIEGTELMAHLVHPGLFGWDGPRDAFRCIGSAPEAGLSAAMLLPIEGAGLVNSGITG